VLWAQEWAREVTVLLAEINRGLSDLVVLWLT
jgi:hypothetical protein